MLLSLTVNNYTLVDHLHLEFHRGMTAMTGETGAGKSLVLDALAMALGDRGDIGCIRTPGDKLDVTATFAVVAGTEASAWLGENAFDNGSNDSEECMIRRTLGRDGRSRGFINGSPATMQQLKLLGEMMIDIHGQHEHQSLLRRETHRRLLDAFGGCEALCGQVTDLYRQWRQTLERLESLSGNAEETAARSDLLSFQLAELEDVVLAPEELESLEQEQQRLANGEQVLQDSRQILALCSEGEDGDALGMLRQALQLLRGMPGKTPALSEAEAMIDSAAIQVEEACRELQNQVDRFDLDPERLTVVESRLSLIYQVARKHRCPPRELGDLQQRLAAELAALNTDDNNLEELSRRLSEIDVRLGELEAQLSEQRRRAADIFATEVNRQLAELAMGAANLQVELKTTAEHGPQGRETVEFLISGNPGQPHRPLNKIASGGELSRIALAIQVIAARNSTIPTLVFDEVDVGIGGAVAEIVGKLLQQLGQEGQVICVTHLPQVASCAHHHYLANKHANGDAVETTLQPLNEEDRVEEIARMLGGSKITAQTRAHAKEMLTLSSPP